MKSTVLILVFNFVCLVNLSFSENLDHQEQSKKVEVGNQSPRAGRAGLIAFKPFGTDVNVGLDLLLPFVKIPTKRKLNENESNEALVTVNTAAITIGGLISGIGIFIGHLLRSLVTLRGRENTDDSSEVETKAQSAEHRLDFDAEGGRFTRMLGPFKLVYRNSSGVVVDTSFTTILNVIEDIFLEKDIDLNACMQKSLCSLVQRANINMEKGVANGIEKMIDALLQLNWIMRLTHETAIEEAIIAGKSNSTDQCLLKYRTCKLESPQQQLYEIIKTRVNFV